MFKKFKSTTFKKLLSTVALVCFLLVVLVFVCWMNLISYITAGNLIKTTIYIFIYVFWNTYLLSLFNSLSVYVTINWTMFFSVSVFFLLYFFSFWTEIVLSISFRRLTKTAIKRYSTTYICFQFDKPYKIM